MASNGYSLAHPADLDGETSYTFTCGKIDAGIAVLIGSHAHLIEFPSLLLPPGCEPGSIVSITCARDLGAEKAQADSFWELQNRILNQFGLRSPVTPALRLRSVTQTSITLEWDKLELAQSKLLSLSIWKNGQRLGTIPNPMNNTSTKLSGLDLDTEYNFYLVMKTTGGTFNSNKITVKTHSLNDTSGINVCFGVLFPEEILEQSKRAVDQLNARWSDKIQIDTTHFVCTMAHQPAQAQARSTQASSFPSLEYQRALQLSIPIVQPSWLLACLSEKKMVPIAAHYLGTQPPPLNSLPSFSSASITHERSASKPAQSSSPVSPAPSKSTTPTSPHTPDASTSNALESASETPKTHLTSRPDQLSTPHADSYQAGLGSSQATPNAERSSASRRMSVTDSPDQTLTAGRSSGTTITVEQPLATHSVLSDMLHDAVDGPDRPPTEDLKPKHPPQMVVTPSGAGQTHKEAEDDPFSASSPTISNPSPCGEASFRGLKFDLSSTGCSPITPVGARPGTKPQDGEVETPVEQGSRGGGREEAGGAQTGVGLNELGSELGVFEDVSVDSAETANEGPVDASEAQVTESVASLNIRAILDNRDQRGGDEGPRGESEVSGSSTSGDGIDFENRVAGIAGPGEGIGESGKSEEDDDTVGQKMN